MDEELRRLLPHSLLIQCANIRAPLSTPHDLEHDELFGADFSPAWPVLLALSKFGPSTAHDVDFMAAGVLPPPEDRQFPVLAFGLIALLDQAPRTLFSGANERYTNAYFDPMALKFLRQCIALPSHLSPWKKHRWVDELGYSVSQWIWVQTMFIVSSPHCEDLEQHDWHINHIFRPTRSEILAATGMKNPYEKDLEGELGRDLYAFPRVATQGPPTKEKLGREPQAGDVFYWYDMIICVHRPIIATFGRYPYRNTIFARPSTEKEELWIKETNGFATIDEDSAKQIADDVRRGVWSPLTQE